MINQNYVIDDIRIASRNRYSCIYGSLYDKKLLHSNVTDMMRLFAAEESNEFFETNHRKHSSDNSQASLEGQKQQGRRQEKEEAC